MDAAGQPAQQSEPVIRKLFELRELGQSGVLEVEAEAVCTVVYLARGIPVFAEEGTLGETLGRILLRDGALTQEHYSRIIERMTSSVMGAEQMRFGEVAIALGCLTAQQVNDALAKQVRRKLVRCIGAPSATCVFREDSAALEGIARYPCAIEPLILRTVCARFEEPRVTRVLAGTAAAYPRLLQSLEQVSRAFGMAGAEAAFVAEINGARMTAELVATALLGGLHATQLLAVLALAGLVEFGEQAQLAPTGAAIAERAPAEPTTPPPEQPVAVLVRESRPEPSRRPSEAAQAAARQRLARRLARPGDSGAQSARRRRVAVSSSEGPKITRSPAPVAKQARLRAEQLFQSGRLHLRNERWALAHHDLQQAARLYPSAVEYQLYAEWARFQTLTEGAELGVARERLHALASQAMRQDQRLAFAHHVTGQVKLMRGDEPGALRSFRIASKLDPDDRVAARYYRMLKRKRGQSP